MFGVGLRVHAFRAAPGQSVGAGVADAMGAGNAFGTGELAPTTVVRIGNEVKTTALRTIVQSHGARTLAVYTRRPGLALVETRSASCGIGHDIDTFEDRVWPISLAELLSGEGTHALALFIARRGALAGSALAARADATTTIGSSTRIGVCALWRTRNTGLGGDVTGCAHCYAIGTLESSRATGIRQVAGLACAIVATSVGTGQGPAIQ